MCVTVCARPDLYGGKGGALPPVPLSKDFLYEKCGWMDRFCAVHSLGRATTVLSF